jgi:hypothetical protein
MELTPTAPHRGDCITGDEENEDTCSGNAVGPKHYDNMYSEVRGRCLVWGGRGTQPVLPR